MRMSNIGTVLRKEITRLSRRESRGEMQATRKATAVHRRDIAALKRQVTQLERQVAQLSRKAFGPAPQASSASPPQRVRFVAQGLRSQRNRLGLSAVDFGKLLGVSAQSIYNWERKLAHPRGEQQARLAALRGIGKREAAARLKQLGAANGKKQRQA
jgi:DNA-binding transcriptional regulator YiaG